MPSFTFTTREPLPETAKELQQLLGHLFSVREELTKEIERLMGSKQEAAKPYHCVRCDYKWKSRLSYRPKQCPVCRAKKFDVPPIYTYEEKIARKKERLAKQKSVEPDPFYRENFKEYAKETEKELRKALNDPPIPHSVLTRSIPEPDVSAIALTPPPTAPLSLRERLEHMKRQAPAEQPDPIPAPEPVIIATDDELVEAINNGDDDAA